MKLKSKDVVVSEINSCIFNDAFHLQGPTAWTYKVVVNDELRS